MKQPSENSKTFWRKKRDTSKNTHKPDNGTMIKSNNSETWSKMKEERAWSMKVR